MREPSSHNTNTLKVLHVDHATQPGGAELALRRLVSTALRRGMWNPTIIVPRTPDTLGAFLDVADVVVEAGPAQQPGAASSRNPLTLARFTARILEQARIVKSQVQSVSPSVIHANTTRGGLYSALHLNSTVPLVLHLRDMIEPSALGRPSFEAFRRIALIRASGVIANSEATLATAEPFLPRSTLSAVIPSPSGLGMVTPGTQPTVETVKRVGMVARLTDWKGQALLIRAFAQAFGQSDTSLHFYGGVLFEKRAYLDQLINLTRELGVHERTHFHGHVEDVRAAIASLDVCVQASTRPEPLGQNVLQYLALGKPTIAVNAGGPAELIQDGRNGLLFEMGSLPALVHALSAFRDSRELRSSAASLASRTRILSDTDIALAHLDFFERVARRRSIAPFIRNTRNHTRPPIAE